LETAKQKVRAAQGGWNSRDAVSVAQAYTTNSRWRNRDTFLTGRAEIEAFLTRKWQLEREQRLIKKLWAYAGNRIEVCFAYEWHKAYGRWFRSFGIENWEFAAGGLMQRRIASINDLAIRKDERKFHWPHWLGQHKTSPPRSTPRLNLHVCFGSQPDNPTLGLK